jgi:sugar lactone lactonase YvrE
MSISIEIFHRAKMSTGECPVWSVAEQQLYAIDIEGRALFRLDAAGGLQRCWTLPNDVGSFALREGGHALMALRDGLYDLDLATDVLVRLAEAPYDQATMRFNDGRADAAGRFWVTTMHEPRTLPAAELLCYADGRLAVMSGGLLIGNGLAFSPDQRTLYLADTLARRIHAFDYDAAEGTLLNKRLFVELAEGDGVPDGAAVDSAGCYWAVLPRVGRLARYTPAGRLDRAIDMPVQFPTMCAFGGAQLDTLFVTSMSRNLSSADRENGLPDGSIFALRPGVTGLAEPVLPRLR